MISTPVKTIADRLRLSITQHAWWFHGRSPALGRGH